MTTVTPSTEPSTQPVIRRSKGISTLWLLPLLALAICTWLLIDVMLNRGVTIVLYFENAQGLIPGKTQVISNGLPVGSVKSLTTDIERRAIKATVIMERQVEELLVDDSLFWIVKPELSTTRVEGLDTLLTGSYIGFRPGTTSTPAREFTGLMQPPPVAREAPGLHIRLQAETLGSVQLGTGVYYKNFQIGSVQKYSLDEDDTILIDLYIEPEYRHVIRNGSRFCHASGLAISGELTNLKVQLESLASLIRGGILVHTPEQLVGTEQAENGHEFPLYRDYDAANYGLPMTLKLASGSDLVEGATKVIYRGIEAGFVKEISINDDERRTVTAHVLLDPRAELILRRNTQFWLVKPAISADGISNLRTLVTGSYITFKPGDGEFSDQFELLPEPPAQEPLRAGATYLLETTQGHNLSKGAPVFYKDIQVGEVTDLHLTDEGRSVRTTIFIYEPHRYLVKNTSVFWVEAGIDFSADLSGISLSLGSLRSLVSGSILFTSPDTEDEAVKRAPANTMFTLYGDRQAAISATPALQPQGVHFTLTAQEARGVSIGSPIMQADVVIGRVTGLRIQKAGQGVVIDCLISPHHRRQLGSSPRFYTISGIELEANRSGLALRIERLETMLKGAIGCLPGPTGNWTPAPAGEPLFASLEEALHADDIEISVLLEDGGNVHPGTALRYRGVGIGKVVHLRFADDLRGIEATLRVAPRYVSFFTTTTKIWLVTPEISLTGVRHPETALFGPYLTLLPGTGEPRTSFTALPEPPSLARPELPGLPVIIVAPRLGSLSIGSPLYYRDLKIGEITDFELSPTYQQVLIKARIAAPYQDIVRTNSLFWNVSGTRIEGGLLAGLSITTGSIESIIRGGVAMATPDSEPSAPRVLPGHHFSLRDTPPDNWLKWNPDLALPGP